MFATLTPNFASALIIPADAEGYVGEITPDKRSFFFKIYNNGRGGTIGMNNQIKTCASFKEESIYSRYLFKIPGTNEYGLRLVNTSLSDTENANNYLVAAINGVINTKRFGWGGGTAQSDTFTLVRSKGSSKSLSQRGPLCWEVDYTSMLAEVSLYISTYSIYAQGKIKPGYYQFSPIMWTAVTPSSNASSGYEKGETLSWGSSPITVLKNCNVSTNSETYINFNPQLSKNYSSPTLLDNKLASMQVSCPDSGNLYIVIKPYNDLVSGSNTGMKMVGNKNNEDAPTPYISVSDGNKSVSNNVCGNNATSAFKYFDGQSIGSIKQNSPIMKLLSFNLCAKGSIPTDAYKGSIDVSFIVE